MNNNQKTKELIINHFNKYPNLKIQDLFKFLFQSSFGCEHLVSSLDKVKTYLNDEYNNIKQSNFSIDSLDGNYSRVPLSYIDKGLSIDTFSKLFYLSSKTEENGLSLLKEKLNVLCSLAKDNLLPFSINEVCDEINKWKEQNYPAVHHSNEFRSFYKPSYRLISNDYITYLPLFIEIDKLINKEHIIVAIDGGSASGKTTLGNLLKKVYDCNLFHMDDFFLQQNQRTKERLDEVGGNIDKERFLEEILIPLKNNEIIRYRKFDCSTMSLSDYLEITPKKITIIEGAYSLHPELSSYYDLSVFLKISPEFQKERIILRNNSNFVKRFFEEWIPLENIYFDKTNIMERSNLIINIKK